MTTGTRGTRGIEDEGDLVVADDTLCDRVLTAATDVHRALGPGLLEDIYEAALVVELKFCGINLKQQVSVSAKYRGIQLGVGYRADIIVENRLLLELKTVDAIADIHVAQVITYLKLLHMKTGYILNFNARLMKEGIKRISI